jgi:hypothetical protein
MTDPSEVTTRSIRFGSCVAVGLLMSYLDGVSNLDIARTALIATVLFLAFMVGEAALMKYRKKR